MCHFFFLWGVNVSLTSRCVHQQRHLENRELLHTSSSEGFSTTFLRLPPSPSWGYLYFSLGNTSMMTLRLIPDVRGKNCVKLWLLDPNWAQMCFSYSRFCSILFQVCSLHSALLCAEAFFGGGGFFAPQCDVNGKKEMLGRPPPPQKSKKRRKTHLPSCCVQELLVHP